MIHATPQLVDTALQLRAVTPIFDQCDNEIHVSSVLRQLFVSKLQDILCEVDGDRESGHCLRG